MNWERRIQKNVCKSEKPFKVNLVFACEDPITIWLEKKSKAHGVIPPKIVMAILLEAMEQDK